MSPLNFPVVLIHGFSDTSPEDGTLGFAQKFLDGMQVAYFTPQIPAYGSIEERSISLIGQIATRYPHQNVHLFGHSMGGLNARDIAAKAMIFYLGFIVRTVTTFGTPHRGVKWNPLRGKDGAEAVPDFIRRLCHTDFGAVGNLSHKFMTTFNQKTANNPDVKYFAWAGKISTPTTNCTGIFVLSRLSGPTDGVVEVDSAEWENDLGPGTHLGTVRGLDHSTIVCDLTVTATIPHLQAAEWGHALIVQPVKNNLPVAIARRIAKNYTSS